MSQLPSAPKQHQQRQQHNQHQQYGSTDTEQRLLDALEAATVELHAHTLQIQETVLGQNQQLTNLTEDVSEASESIRNQRTRLTAYRDYRNQTEHLYYSIIFIEVVILLFIIIAGLD